MRPADKMIFSFRQWTKCGIRIRMLETFEIIADAVADASRIRILKLLQDGELCVCQITTVLNLAPATVSKHLAILKAAGLVQMRREGKWVHYRLAERAFNPYAPRFLAMLGDILADDPTVAEDRRVLAMVRAVPVAAICGLGRQAVPALEVSSETACCGGRP